MKILLNEKQFKNIVVLLSENDDKKINVMFVGDSHSDGQGYTWNYDLEKQHPEWNVTHIVKGGKTTEWMLENMLPELTKKHYDLVFILGGTNDVMSPLPIETPINNIQKMVNAVNTQGGKAIVVIGFDSESIMDVNKLRTTKYCDKECLKKFKPKRVEFQRKLESSIQNATIVPPLVGDYTWANDGIHVGGSKHKLLSSTVENYITKENTKPNKKTTISQLLDKYTTIIQGKNRIDTTSPTNEIKLMQILFSIVEGQKNRNFSGVLDSDTITRLKKYQASNDIPETGIFDYQTIYTINNKLSPSLNKGLKSETPKKTISDPGSSTVSANKLVNDLKSFGLTENAAKGLTANAYGESGLNYKAKGDSGTYAKNSVKSINIGGKKYCSFGLWQFNVCGGLGIEFLKKYNTLNGGDMDKIETLFDYNKQLEIMGSKIMKEQSKGDKSVKTWIDWIVDNVERPADRTGAKQKRQNFAKQQGWV